MEQNDIRAAFLSMLHEPDYRPGDTVTLYSKLCERLGIDHTVLTPGAFGELLRTLESEAEIAYGRKGKIMTGEDAGFIRAVFRSNPRGFGFAVPEEAYRRRTGGDLFIPPDATAGAITGDHVIVQMTTGRRADGRGGEGRVLRITERALRHVVGTFYVEPMASRRRESVSYVLPDNRRYDIAVRVEGEIPAEVKVGDKIEVEITSYPHSQVVRNDRRTAGGRGESGYYRAGLLHVRGRFVRSFGDADSAEANYHAILSENGIPSSFPPDVTEAAERAASQPLSPEGRLDLREKLIITIDGADARDLDDAISVERTADGWLLGVHIADVSHYVRPSTPLDAEALARGTSVYFPDRVVPMLPPALSNGACSLNADADRYALSALISLDAQGNILSCTPAESVIRSRLRGVYSELNDVIAQGNASAFAEKYSVLGDMLPDMLALYRILEAGSRASGALSFETSESLIRVENLVPVEIARRERGISERLIEQFMLCANRAIAEWLFWQDLPCVYRIHENPQPEKIQSFAVFAHNLGLDVTPLRVKKLHPAALSRVLDQAEELGLQSTVSIVMLRALAKARYSAAPSPHFGLAIDKYCHFTSPIRRYPDCAVHRIVKATLHGEIARQITRMSAFAEEAAVRSSENELRAVAAERAVDDLFRVLYLQQHLGETFDGTVSSVGPFGFFVTLDNSCEGLVPMISLGEGYVYEESSLTVSRGRSVFSLGMRVRVRVSRCEIRSRRADFTLSEAW